MKIWKLSFATDEYDYLTAVDKCFDDKIRLFDGRSHIDNWIPTEVMKLEPEKELSLANAIHFYSSLPIFDSKAKSILEKICGSSVEILPLVYSEKEVWAINIIKVLDCMEYEKSKYKTFSKSGRIMYFSQYVFKPEIVLGEHIFKIKDMPLSGFFVSDEFKQLVEENNLTGFNFKLVWDSEEQ